LPAWSVSILPDCKNAVYNTAKVGYLCFYSCFPSDNFQNNATVSCIRIHKDIHQGLTSDLIITG
jgi:hypothetical protein